MYIARNQNKIVEHSLQILELKTKLAGFADHNASCSSLFLSTTEHFANPDGPAAAAELRAELEAKEAEARELTGKLAELERANHDLRDELTAAVAATEG